MTLEHRLLVAILLLTGSVPSLAQETGNELTVFGGHRAGGSFDVRDSDVDYDVADGASFGVILNRGHDANTQWEIYYSRQDTEAEAADLAVPLVDLDSQTLQLGGTYLWEAGKTQPYLALTLGGTRVRASGAGTVSDTFWSGSLGVGLRVAPSARVGLRLEARALGILTREKSDLFCRLGPDISECAIRVEGKLLSQLEAYAGLTLRF